MQVSAATPRTLGGLPYKWVVAIVVIFGFFMTILDSTIVNIAIPRLQSVFGANLTDVQWVLTSYTLVQGVATPLTAFLAQRLGQKRLYLIALGGFTLGSAMCGLAWSLPVLIFFRVLQGAMGAFMSPLAITLLYSEFPLEERGTAMGALGVPILLAPAFGPTVGGYIVTFLGWQLIFYINVPIGILGIILGIIYLRERRPPTRTSFDIPGFITSAVGLAALLYGLSDASTDGWGSVKVVGALAAGVVMLIVFILVEVTIIRRGGQPLLDLRVFVNGPFTTSTIASALVTFALYGGLFIIPVYLQDLRGLSAYQAGLLLLPQAFASMIASLIAGRLVDKLGVRAVVIPGLIILAVALWLFTRLGANTPYGTVQIWLIVRSLALGFCFQPLSVSALSAFGPRDLPQASSVSTTVRFVMSSFAVAVIATLVQTQTAIHYAHLAEMVTPSSRLGQLIPELQALFMSQGGAASTAYSAAIQTISGLLQEQATILAMRDAFWVSVALTMLGIVATFFVRFRRPQLGNESMNEEELAEAARAREEAMMSA